MYLSEPIAIIYDKKGQDSLIPKVSFLNQIEIYTCASQMIVVSNFFLFNWFDLTVFPCWCHILYNLSCRICLPFRITDSLHCKYTTNEGVGVGLFS